MLKKNFLKIEILGAGPAGLGVGYYAKKKGIPLSTAKELISPAPTTAKAG